MLPAVTSFGESKGHKELVPYLLLKVHLLAADLGSSFLQEDLEFRHNLASEVLWDRSKCPKCKTSIAAHDFVTMSYKHKGKK